MKRRRIAAAVCLLSVIAAPGAAHMAGLRINRSPSIPLGFYWLSGGDYGKGDFVVACPPVSPVYEMAKERGYINAGFCPGAYSTLMKRIEAVHGDTVAFSKEGVHVNGHLLSMSQAKSVDPSERPMPQLGDMKHVLTSSEVLLMGSGAGAPISFDSRYVGLFDRALILGKIRPLLTW